MKQRLFQNMLKAAGAFLFAVTMSAGFTACIVENDNPVTPVAPEEPERPGEEYVEPTEDAVEVTTNYSYAVFGNIDDEMGKAISRRLKGTPDVPSMAQIYFLDPQRGVDLGMGEEKWQELVGRTRDGVASLILSQCTFSDFYTFTKYYIQGMVELAAKQYASDDPDEKPDVSYLQAEAEQRMADALFEGWDYWRKMQPNPDALAEPDWENIDSWPAEMQDAVMFDAWGFRGAGNILYVMHGAMQNDDDEVKPVAQDDQAMTAYRWGQKADAVARWINDQLTSDAQTRAGMENFRRALTRGESSSIKDIIGAYTETKVFDYIYPDPHQPGTCKETSAITVIYTIYSAYDFDSKKDYYQVQQKVSIANDKLPKARYCWRRHDDYSDGYKWVEARGTCMKDVRTSMKLSGSGTISVYDATPGNENKSRTFSHNESSSSGWSFSPSLGYQTLYGAISYSTSVTFDDGYSWSSKDLVCSYNRNGSQVKWDYKGQGRVTWGFPYKREQGHWFGGFENLMPDILVNTCDLNQDVIWMVENPNGDYQLQTTLDIVTFIEKEDQTWYHGTWPFGEYRNNYGKEEATGEYPATITLPTLPRYKRNWHMVVTAYGNLTETSQTDSFDNWLASNSMNWKTDFYTAETSANGSSTAKSQFGKVKETVDKGLKDAIKLKYGKGTYKFELRLDGQSTATASFTIEIE
jgi:hypothetical protein